MFGWGITYRRGLWITAVGGLILTLALLVAGRRVDAERQRVRDDAALDTAAGALRAQLDLLEDQVRDVAGLFEASRNVEPEEFAAFVDPLLRRSRANGLVFLQEVPDARRAAFERARGAPIRELRRDGTLAVAARRLRYLVLTRGAYNGGGRGLDGVDLLTQPGRRATIERAERSGEPAATRLIVLARSGSRGLAVYAPVRGRRPGVVAGSFSQPVLQAALRQALGDEVGMRVRAVSGPPLATAGAAPHAGAPSRPIDFAGQRFTVQASVRSSEGLRLGVAAPLAMLGLTLLAVLAQSGRRSRRRLAVGEARFADAFEASPIGQALAFPDGRLARVNHGLCAITGSDCDALLDRSAIDLVDPADRERAAALMNDALATPGLPVGAEVRVLTAAGATRWAQLHFTRLRDPEAAHPLLTQVIDVSDRRGLEVELRRQAEHDALTDLLNRRGFQRVLGALLARTGTGAVMLIDLDHFKAVNDTLGHHVGDQVIRAAGLALRGSVRPDDVVARIGGDEFAVLLAGADRERAHATAERLVQAVSAHTGLPGAHGVTASVGVAMLEAGVFPTADDALMAADLAMYDAKEAGRRRMAFYDDRSTSGTQTRLQWVDRIRTALAEERLALVAQPILDLASGRLAHHEVLLRMLDAEGRLIGPDAFLPIAESFGLMAEIDRWVVTQAIRAIGAHPDRDLVLEVNLSGSSLGSPELLATIRSELHAGDVSPARIIFEVTETEAVTNLEEAHAFASELAALGCRFALDDFGVGFGSFAYVKHLPFDFLKIDGEFVRHSATNDADRVILESLIHAARGLGKQTIAEYVEDAGTAELLRELGVDLIQGYYVGSPRGLQETIAGAARLTSSGRWPAAPSAGS